MSDRAGVTGDTGAAEVIAQPIEPELAPNAWQRLLARVPRGRLAEQVGWVTFAYAFSQGMRLVTNVVLAYLLAPQLFGVMLIVNTLRTGLELLSDIGISHNIISNPRDDQPEVQLVIPLTSVLFILTGFQAPSRFLMMKHGEMRAYSLSEIALGVASLAIHVGLALYTPTVWALFLGLVFTSLFQTLLTHWLMERGTLRFQLERESIGQILSFGKWVFASSLIYFLAMNYDRLYFAKAIPFAVLGVYGVARTFSDTAAQLVQRMGGMLIYPKIAASRQDGPALRAMLAPVRGRALLVIVAGLSFGIAIADRIILLLYDGRYHAAAFMLPILMAGVWFSILATLGESVMMGTGRPAHAARANFAKFVFTCVGLPLAIGYDGLALALLVIATGDLVRYMSLAVSERAQQMSFIRQDAALTLLLFGLAFVWRIALELVGIVPALSAWWSLGASLRG